MCAGNLRRYDRGQFTTTTGTDLMRLLAGLPRLIAYSLLAGAAVLGGCAAVAPRAPLSCEQLATLTVPSASIGLPTNGAKVVSAVSVAASGVAPKNFGAYCQVAGEISPIDPAAPKIKFQIAMPVQWNHRALMLGGGGYGGTVPNVAGNVPAGPSDSPNPVGRGYAVFGSDSGHEGQSNQGWFGANDEALKNFSYEALKKTRDAALFLIDQRYGERPQRSYFAGGSTGGREALAVAQKWPKDFDGVISLYPAFNAASLDLQFGRITRALAQPGAFLNLAKRKALYDAAYQACDGFDGVVDGLISNQPACNASFNPSTAVLNGKPLRCERGDDTGDTCLSDAQIAAMNVINTPIKFNYPLANGDAQYPGFNAWGADFGHVGTAPLQAYVNFLGMSTVAPAYPMPAPPLTVPPAAGPPYGSTFWDQWIKYFVTRDVNFNSFTIDPENPGPWAARISELTGWQDANKADLSDFESRGGKILMAHGTSDQLVSTRATEQYYGRVRAAMGVGRADGFLRFYEIPGYNHAASTTFNAAWDSVTALENWVEKGVAPPDQVVFDTVGVPGRSRPLCVYPGWPKYKGGGDVNAAASFVCVGS